MARFLDRLPPLNNTGATWLARLRADPRMADQDKALKIATELARYLKHDGSGEMPSPADLARLSGMKEDEVETAVNLLVLCGFVALVYRPRIRFSVAYFVRPSAYHSQRLKAVGIILPDAAR
jgi:hypothetical protein